MMKKILAVLMAMIMTYGVEQPAAKALSRVMKSARKPFRT